MITILAQKTIYEHEMLLVHSRYKYSMHGVVLRIATGSDVIPVQHELGEVTRRLDHERAESDRLSGEAAAERLRARQLEREGDQLRNDLEEYRSGRPVKPFVTPNYVSV